MPFPQVPRRVAPAKERNHGASSIAPNVARRPRRAAPAKGRIGQRGAALLAAMLTVTLVATFAAAALWQQWRSVEIEAAERARVQSGWILTGALDWSRLILRADALGSNIDHLGEPWAVALEESRLSTFLAADQNNTGGQTLEDSLEAFLSGSITDMQSRLNLRNLVQAGKVGEPAEEMFDRLFELLGLPRVEMDALAENLRRAAELGTDADSAEAPIWPERIEQLTAYGLSPATLKAIEPYVALLPARTSVNVNTASAVVLAASEPKLTLPDAERVVAARASQPFISTTHASMVLGKDAGLFAGDGYGVQSNFFEVRGRLRLESITLEERSLVQREGQGPRVTVKTISRQRVVSDERALAAAAGAGQP